MMIPSTFLRLEHAPVRLWPGKHSFSWEASVDSRTGIARSKEISYLNPKRSNLHKQWQKLVVGQDDTDIWMALMERLSDYPKFLALPSVTFGLFRAVTRENGKEIALQDRIFGMDILVFDAEPRTQRFSVQKQIPSVRGSAHPWTMIRIGDCTVTIPIKGGLLACNKAKVNPNNRDRNNGLLRFEVKHNGEFEQTQIKTEIQQYTPAIVGKQEPVPIYRKLAYLLTQSIVHAFVMWRFHKFCSRLECDLSERPQLDHGDPTNTVRIIKF
jgi:hypothetical protein